MCEVGDFVNFCEHWPGVASLCLLSVCFCMRMYMCVMTAMSFWHQLSCWTELPTTFTAQITTTSSAVLYSSWPVWQCRQRFFSMIVIIISVVIITLKVIIIIFIVIMLQIIWRNWKQQPSWDWTSTFLVVCCVDVRLIFDSKVNDGENRNWKSTKTRCGTQVPHDGCPAE